MSSTSTRSTTTHDPRGTLPVVELTPLRYFRVIARTGHLTRAARTLGVSQSTLSSMLKKLEAEVGTPLLHRTAHGVELTEAGALFLEHAESALRSVDNAVSGVRQLLGLEIGSIRIGGGATATTYVLPRVVGAFRKAHPGVRFSVRELGSAAIASAVVLGELDLGIVTLPLPPGSADLMASPLATDELRLIVPPGHAMAKQKSFRWMQLSGEPVIAFEAGSAVREIIDHASADAGVTLNVVMELRSIESIKQMVSAAIGVGFVSRFALPDQAGLGCRDGRLTRDLAIIRRSDRVPSPAVVTFERMLHDHATR